MLLTLALALLALASFIHARISPDLTGISVFCLLLLCGSLFPDSTLPTPSALIGVFANPAALTIGAMVILSGAMKSCGAMQGLQAYTDRLARFGYHRCLLMLIVGVAFVSAFVNNTPVVIMFAPLVISLSHKLGESPARLLMPLSFASIFGGICTLVGTSTNLLVNGIAMQSNQPSLGLFELGKIGLPLLVCSAAYLTLVCHRWLPERVGGEATDEAPEIPERTAPNRRSIVITIGVLAGVIIAPMLWDVPIVVTAMCGCVVLALTKVFPLAQAYRSLDISLLILIYSMLGLGMAMDATGTARYIVHEVTGWMGLVASSDNQAWIALLLVFALTSLLTELLSNSATAAIMTPIALGFAETLAVDARPFIVAICIAASASFATPIGYQTNTYVYRLGGYRFSDFLRIGIPLNVLYLVVSMILIPLIWPF